MGWPLTPGALAIIQEETTVIRRYLLGQLPEVEEEQVELRLLNDADYAEEFDIIVSEMTDQYARGEFHPEERESFEQYFFKSPDRQAKLRFALAFKQRRSELMFDRLRKKNLLTFYLPIAACLIVALGLGLGIWRVYFAKSDVDRGLVALQNAFREERPNEARISSLDYAPYLTRRGSETDKVDQNELRRAELTLLEALKKNPTPAAHHALGQVLLARKDFDKAIEQFDDALKGDPKNAQLYSDLGAAWLEKGRIDREGPEPGKGMEGLGRSLENLNRALELNPNLLEALFNRALSRQYQSLYAQAEADWREYLKRDPSSQWAIEANQNIKLIEGKKVSSSSTQQRPVDIFLSAFRTRDDHAAWEVYRRSHASTGNTITKDLIDAFLLEIGSSKPGDSLQALNYLGQLQLRNANDPYDADLARVYGSATPEVRATLSKARRHVIEGYELFRQSKITESMELFSRARDTFNAAGDTGEALFAEYSIAYGATVQPDLEKSEQILARIIPICEARGYKWLLGQCLTERAHLQANLNNYSEAVDDSHRALSVSEDLQDHYGTLGGFVQLASLYLFLNDSEQSLSFIHRGLAWAEKERAGPSQVWGMYIAAALDFDNLNLNRAAFDFLKEALGLALSSQVPIYISRSHEYLGLTYGKLRQYDEAIKNVRQAYEQGHVLAADRNGQNMMASASLKLGDLHRTFGEHAQALDAYNRSADLYKGLGFNHYSYLAHKGKLRVYLAQQNDAMASQELAVVLQLFEDYRERILEERQRSFFFDKEQDVYDLGIDFAYSRAKDANRAFEYSETSRARSLLDLLRHGGLVVERNGKPDFRVPERIAKPLPIDKIREMMPDRVQLLQYAVLKDRVVIWVIMKSGFTARSTEIDSRTLAADVANTLRAIGSSDETEAATQLKRLYGILIKPIADLLNQDNWLCIIPDKELNYLPFGALLSDTSGRHLVQDFRITLSPSSSVFINCTKDAETKNTGKIERLLVVGNPSFDREAYPQYPYLTAAQREADEIAALYPSRRRFVKADATVSMVRAELPRSDVAHFAAHYVVDPQSSLSSSLLLAKPEGNNSQGEQDRGELQAREVCKMKLSRTRLVVLSACETGIERQFKGEGPISFARQFIVAGVPLIVASLWPVDSEATAQLMIAFHRHRKSGMPTAEALGRAQQEMITSGDARYRRPYFWGAFMTIGGYAEF